MMSPIAIKSAIAQQKSGFAAKGTGRRSTRFNHPSIREVIENCSTIEALGIVRGGLIEGALKGVIDPSEKTENEWERAFWKRVIELVLTADGVKVCPTFIFNHQLRWRKPAHIEAAIQAALEAQCKILPSPVERWRGQGIEIA